MLSQSVLCPYSLKRVEFIGVESPKSCNGLILQKIRRQPQAVGVGFGWVVGWLPSHDPSHVCNVFPNVRQMTDEAEGGRTHMWSL